MGYHGAQGIAHGTALSLTFKIAAVFVAWAQKVWAHRYVISNAKWVACAAVALTTMAYLWEALNV